MSSRILCWRALARRLAADRRGVTAIVTVIALVVLLGFAGLAIDVAAWLQATRGLQAAADQAVYSAAYAAGTNGCSSTTAMPQALAVAAARGYVNGVNNTTVTMTCNSSTSNFTVKVAQVQPLWFARLFLAQAPTASASAIAQLAGKVSDLCVLALDGTNVEEGVTGSDADAAQIGGNATLDLHCGIAVDSSNTVALAVRSNASSLAATDIYIVGNEAGSSIPLCGAGDARGCATTSPTANNLLANQTPVADPYAGRTISLPSTGCTQTVSGGYQVTSSGALPPGIYCGGLTFGGTGQGNAVNVQLQSGGVYYVVGGSLTFNAGANVSGTGVTFVLTGNTLGQGDVATLRVNGGATLSLTAPTSGPYGGMAFFQDRNPTATFNSNATCGNGNAQNKINGGSGQLITGAIYFPKQSVCYNGNSSTTGAGQCTQLIAGTLDFTGTSDVQLSCAGTGISPITVLVPQLIR